VAAVGQEITVSNESHDVRWFTAEDLLTMIQEPGILRMLRKSEELLSREFELL
jgi:NADH pyrophosphatase NudC (nudix superfamily)